VTGSGAAQDRRIVPVGKRIVIIQGHPDPSGNRFGHALAQAYADGAREAGHEVKLIDVARIEFPLLRTQHDWESGALTEPMQDAQNAIGWADHLAIFFPLWLGSMPALLKGFLEQVMRPGFAIGTSDSGPGWTKRLGGRSARVVVTMGMPALVFRFFFFAHGVRSLERNVLSFCGIAPVRETLIGGVEADAGKRAKWLDTMRDLGRGAR
jgi:putative NADPH-quinone reductase